jgi:hypothetical protein
MRRGVLYNVWYIARGVEEKSSKAKQKGARQSCTYRPERNHSAFSMEHGDIYGGMRPNLESGPTVVCSVHEMEVKR